MSNYQRRHYEQIGKMLNITRAGSMGRTGYQEWQQIAMYISEMFANDNPAFDESRFNELIEGLR